MRGVATKNPQRITLGQKLQDARRRSGMSTADVEPVMGWYVGKLARLEAGTRTVSKAEIERLAELYQIPAAERATLTVLNEGARKRESPSRVADFAQTYVTLERAAQAICYFDAELIHALLQTPAYATEVLAQSSHEDVPDRVADRMARQAILSREDAPAFRAVLGEAALYREVGGVDVLREQLEHLIEVSKATNVGVRILPFSVGAHRGLGVAFTMLDIADPELKRVYIEGFTDATYIHEPVETAVYAAKFEDLWSAALSDDESVTILRRRIDTLGGSHGRDTLA